VTATLAPNPTPEQLTAARAGPQGAFLIAAGPGTGKTFTMVERFRWLVQARRVPADAILAVTFTEAAAAELRERLTRELGMPLENAWIGTFHGVCARLLREQAYLVGVAREIRVLDELAAQDAIFSCDVGTPTIWAARYLTMNGTRRLLGSFNHGSMANAMLQAIGAQATYPHRQVISMSGDGGFSMMMGDFITLTQMGLPVKVIVLNNGTLGFVEMEMKASGFLDTGCDLKNPDFALMAEAMGVRGIRVEKPQELKGAIEAALAHKGPVLVDVVSARQELAMPPRTTLEQAYNFGIFMTKAVLDGRATQLIDLAKVNLFR